MIAALIDNEAAALEHAADVLDRHLATLDPDDPTAIVAAVIANQHRTRAAALRAIASDARRDID